MRRLAVVVVILVVIVGIPVVDSVVSRGAAAHTGYQPAVADVVASAAAQSSQWTCPGGTGSAGPLPARVVLTNWSDQTLPATLTAVSSTGEHRSTTLSVPAGGQISAVPANLVMGPWVGATVLFGGGGAAVSEVLGGPGRWGTTPCASSASSQWYFAEGSTAHGATLNLALMDPGATPAVVDLSFVTPTGVVQPSALEGVVLAPGALQVIDVGAALPSDPVAAGIVDALSGSVVATELEQPGPGGPPGIGLRLGDPEPSTSWSFPLSIDAAGSSVGFHLYDPSQTPARLRLVAVMPGGVKAAFRRVVPGNSVVSLEATSERRLPAGVPYSMSIVSTNGVGVVVERTVSAPSPPGVPRYGVSFGAALGASRWLVPAVPFPGAGAGDLGVENLAGRTVRLTVSAVSAGGPRPLRGLREVVLGPRATIYIAQAPGRPVGGLPLELAASGAVGVSMDALPGALPGLVMLPTFPRSG